MIKRRHTSCGMRQSQSGQAIVEMVVVAGVMISLFIGTWYLGKFHDLQSTAIQTARYAAWERTVKPPSFSDVTLQSQARARLFSWNKNAYKASDGKPNGSNWIASDVNAQWTDPKGQLLVKRPDDVSVRTAQSALPGGAAQKFSKIISSVGGGNLNANGLYTSDVSVKLIDLALLSPQFLPDGQSSLNLTLNEKSALVTDSWDASGAAAVARNTASFSPASIFAKIEPVLSPIKWALSLLEPAFSNFEPGQVCPDVVPADRIDGGPRKNLPVYRGGGACN